MTAYPLIPDDSWTNACINNMHWSSYHLVLMGMLSFAFLVNEFFHFKNCGLHTPTHFDRNSTMYSKPGKSSSLSSPSQILCTVEQQQITRLTSTLMSFSFQIWQIDTITEKVIVQTTKQLTAIGVCSRAQRTWSRY